MIPCWWLYFSFFKGHGKYISVVKFNTFYNIFGISLANNEQFIYKHGFVLHYINHGLKLLSIKKSKPNN